jgi:putative transposase
MSDVMDEEIKRRTARRKPALVVEINMSGNPRNCRKPTMKPCWSCVPDEGWRPCSARTNRDRFDPAGTEGRSNRGAVGKAVSLVWRTQTDAVLPYRPTKAKPKMQERFAEPIKQKIESEPSFGYRTV